jgi:hypothetical protein
MFQELEEFFSAHQHTVAALEAGSTFAAVVVALVLSLVSQGANRTRIKASAASTIIMHETIKAPDYPGYVTVDITNNGILPVMIPLNFFHWRVFFKRGAWLVMPMDYSQGDPWVPQKRYPVEIAARSSQTFYLSGIDTFRTECRDKFIGDNFIDRCRFRFLRARVRTEDGKLFNVKIDSSLRKEIFDVRRGASMS